MARMREWVIGLDEFDTEEDFRVAVERELAGLENMGHRLGRGFVVSPIRRPKVIGSEEIIVTVGWMFGEAVMPMARDTEPEPAEDEPRTDDELIAGIAEPVPVG